MQRPQKQECCFKAKATSSSFFDCFKVVLHLTRVSVPTDSIRQYLDSAEVAQTVHLHQNVTIICATASRFAVFSKFQHSLKSMEEIPGGRKLL